MKIRMKGTVSGTRDGQDWPPRGGEIEVSDEEGAALCATGVAEPVAVEPEPEKAVAAEPEKREEAARGRRARPQQKAEPAPKQEG